MYDPYKYRFIVKLLAFVTFSLLCLLGVIGNITFAFVHPSEKSNGTINLAETITIIGIYMGVFKWIIPSKTDSRLAFGSLSPSPSPYPPASPERREPTLCDTPPV
jgi:hypothetical protein